MTAARRLSLAEQALASTLGLLACQSIEDARTGLALEVLSEMAPQVQSAMPVVQALSAAAAEVLTTAPGRGVARGSAAWCGAMLNARAAVADFLFWRASLAVDAARAERNPEGGRNASE